MCKRKSAAQEFVEGIVCAFIGTAAGVQAGENAREQAEKMARLKFKYEEKQQCSNT